MKTLGIIGYGDFGNLTHQIQKQYAPEISVYIHDPAREDVSVSFREAARCDVVVLAVPISTFKKTLERVDDIAKETAIVVDVCTVKKHTTTLLSELQNERLWVSTHPLFGPHSYRENKNRLDSLRLVMCDHNLSNAMVSQMMSAIEQAGLNVLEMSADEHDRKIAHTLFFTHLVGQIGAVCELKRTSIDTPSFSHLMTAMESVQNDTDLFHDVFSYNPYCKQVLKTFTWSQKQIAEEING